MRVRKDTSIRAGQCKASEFGKMNKGEPLWAVLQNAP
jgi:hypothetical protein